MGRSKFAVTPGGVIKPYTPRNSSKPTARHWKKMFKDGTQKVVLPKVHTKQQAKDAISKTLTELESKASRTTGYNNAHATYKGRFPKSRKRYRRKASKYDKYGVTWMRETHSNQSDPECTYIMHGFPAENGARALIGAAYRALMHQAGYDIKSWQDIPLIASGLIQIRWSTGASTSLSSATVGFDNSGNPLTHYGMFNALFDAIRTALNDNDGQSSIQFSDINLWADLLFTNLLGRVSLRDFYISYDYYSIIKIKNTTQNAAGTDVFEIDTIYAQPIVGRKFTTDKWSTGFENIRSDTGAAVQQITAGVVTGAAQCDSQYFTTNNALNPFRKMVPGYMFGTKKTATCRLDPGEIKTSVIKWKAKMSFNTACNKLLGILATSNGSTTAAIRPIGKAELFAFEREIELANDGTRPVNVSYEVTYNLKCVGITQTPKAAAIVDTTD